VKHDAMDLSYFSTKPRLHTANSCPTTRLLKPSHGSTAFAPVFRGNSAFKMYAKLSGLDWTKESCFLRCESFQSSWPLSMFRVLVTMYQTGRLHIRKVASSRNASDVYSVGARFGSRTGPYWLMIFVVFLSHAREIPGQYIKIGRAHSFQFI
jgi:hypothetical protein